MTVLLCMADFGHLYWPIYLSKCVGDVFQFICLNGDDVMRWKTSGGVVINILGVCWRLVCRCSFDFSWGYIPCYGYDVVLIAIVLALVSKMAPAHGLKFSRIRFVSMVIMSCGA